MTMSASVLTPSLNYGRYLRDALESVRLQEGVEVEHVIQDGASSDDTITVLESLTDPHVRWRSEQDAGQSDALNRALQRATGDWIAWLNADEFYLPGALRALIDAAEARDLDVVYGDTAFVDENGNLLRLQSHHPFRASYLRWYGCYFASCSTIFRREVLGKTPWDLDFRLAMDWDLYLRLHEAGARFGYLRYPVGAFRMHSMQAIAREDEFGSEFEVLQRQHRVKTPRQLRLGRIPHDVDKLVNGAYGPQVRARRFHGTNLRWFDPAVADGRVTWKAFLRSCYGTTDRSDGIVDETSRGHS